MKYAFMFLLVACCIAAEENELITMDQLAKEQVDAQKPIAAEIAVILPKAKQIELISLQPTEYFTGVATVCCLIPYGWRFPRFWPVTVATTLLALFAYRLFVRKHDVKLRDWSTAFPSKVQSQFLAFTAALIFGNALLVLAL